MGDSPNVPSSTKVSKFASVVSPENIALLSINLAAYAAMQALFFKLVGSKQYDNTLYDKVDMATVFTSFASPGTKESICEKSTTQLRELKEAADKEKIVRSKANNFLLLSSVGPFSLLATIVGCVYLGKAVKEGIWKKDHNILLVLILGAFTTEIIIFLTVIKPYSIVGDYQLVAEMIRSRQSEVCFPRTPPKSGEGGAQVGAHS